MHNIKMVVPDDISNTSLIDEICKKENIGKDDHFAFSAIMTKDPQNPNQRILKINCLSTDDNPYTPTTLTNSLVRSTSQPSTDTYYLVPPLELWLSLFRPLLHKMVNKAFPYYQRCIPDKEELMCILNLCIVRLYDQGYYLHNNLIYRSFVNELNVEVRKLKHFTDTVSLDEEICQEDGRSITRLEQLEDPEVSEQAHEQFHYTVKDHWEDMFEKIKAVMLKDMSQLSFDRILIQLKSKTITTDTSRKIQKYRQMFNPNNPARPNAFGKAKGGNKSDKV